MPGSGHAATNEDALGRSLRPAALRRRMPQHRLRGLRASDQLNLRHELADGRLQLAAEIRLDPERPGLSLLDLRRLNKEFQLGARRPAGRASAPRATAR